ncbi:class I SAM-dependent methyltransferase [Acinetobacter silvestris]|uniref:SAM-dependent methyltransferase n=1 Tax=Acinetobacter silvestris TaxID=1977882 RepID=A0A1Y3CLS4_9GAMM|nr:class I SAM-dependent methyltransferase [Acinetobacter silvestris]OTG67117.1 SAM-dependent methyltransferase [Acinetobacter silvestris]
MTHSLHPAAQKGFSSAAELYQQVRPSYPPEIMTWLKDELQLNRQSTVVDLGAGTGKFLNYLQQVTPQTIAIEPIAEMLEQLKIVHPEAQVLQASSDHIPLPSESIDAVLCAQSFHWFANIESLNEIYHILKPEGHLGLVWNQRDEEVSWVKALADLLTPLEGNTPRYHSGAWKKVFEHQFLFRLESVKLFSQLQKGTVNDVVSKRLLSTSFIAAMPPAEQFKLQQQFEQIILEHTGKSPQDEIEFPYVTYAYHFRKFAD